MSKPSPSWQELPFLFKKDVIEYLDLKSRINLSLTSKWNLDFVGSCPQCIYQFFIYLSTESQFFIGLQEAKKSKPIYQYFDTTEDAIESFLNFLRNQKPRFQEFEISCAENYGNKNSCLELFKNFEAVLSEKISRRGGNTIQVQKLTITSDYDVKDQIQGILNCFKADTVIL